MNLEEAQTKSKITAEEKKAIEGYINFGHTQMNVLASFDLEKYFELAREGWYLAGTKVSIGEEQKSPEELGEIILQNIEEFSKVYSAMYKYSQYSNCPNHLYRGVSNKEAKKLREGTTYDRLISTTTDATTAKTFTEYGNAAVLRIKVGEGIPFLNINDFLGVENINRNENEFVLAPFSRITQANYSYKDNDYSYYNIELQPPELRPFKEGEKENFRERIRNEFSSILKIGKQYQELSEQYELNSYRLQKAKNPEDIKYLTEAMDKAIEQSFKLKPILDEFSEIMKNYIQGICLEKQKEYEEARRIVDEDNKIHIAEERKKALEDERRSKISQYNSKALNTSQNFSSTTENLEFYSSDLILKSEKFSEMCSVLGIPFNSEIDFQTIKLYLSNIQGNIDKINEEVDFSSIPEDSEMEVVEPANKALEEFYLLSNQSNTLSQELAKSVQQYDRQAIDDIKRGIDQKVQEIIRASKIEQLKKQKEVTEKRKISWIGRLTGQKRLRELELENLDLQIEFERTRPIVQKSSYSIHDSLSDMVAFSNANLNGQMTPAMEELFSTVPIYFGINRESINRRADEKLNSKPTVLGDTAIKTNEKISGLDEENVCLRQGIQNNIYQNGASDGLKQYSLNENAGVLQFMSILDKISQLTAVRGRFQERSLDKNARDGEDFDDIFGHL